MPPKRKFLSTPKESFSISAGSSKKKKSSTPDNKAGSSKKKKSSTPDNRAGSSKIKKSSTPDNRAGSSKKKKSSTPDNRSNIKPYILCVTEIAEEILSKADNNDRKAAEDKFKIWDGCSDKSQKNSYFENSLFRAVYVSNLYGRRVESFYNLLTDLEKIVNFRECKTVMSLGCGACPEIVAFLHFYETYLKFNCKALLGITGIDAMDDWKIYHSGIEKHFKTNIIFKNESINENYAESLIEVDLILISYSIGPENADLWKTLKTKCKIVIVLTNDENLLNILEENGYTTKNFKDDAKKKSYAYYSK